MISAYLDNAARMWTALVLPEHRSAGLGRGIMTTAVAAYPSRVFALVATDAGRPLYESLGFRAVATVTWHIRDPVIKVRDVRETDAPEIARLLGQLGYPSTAASAGCSCRRARTSPGNGAASPWRSPAAAGGTTHTPSTNASAMRINAMSPAVS
jgi:hypothetical protein